MRSQLSRSITLLSIAAMLASCSAPPALDGCLPEQGATGTFVSGSGNDASGTGTLAAPFRSLTQALEVAPLGTTIHVLCGTFSDASGEAFPLDVSGLAIQGLGVDKTSLAYEGSGTNVTALVVLNGSASVKALEVVGFTGNTIELRGGTTTIEDVVAVGGGGGSMLAAIGSAVAELLRVDLSNGGDEGILVRDTASISVVDSEIRANESDGIDAEGAANVVVRGTRITGNDSSGVETDSSGTIDLGTADDPGGNTILGNAEWQIQDRRAAFAGTTITAVGNDFGTPVSGVKTGPDSQALVWEIWNSGNEIDFGGP
jgi:hypothetical protein